MKKTICLLLALVMCLSLCACGGDNGDTNPTDETTDVITSLEITSEMQKEIEAETEDALFRQTLSVWIAIQYEDYEFTDIEITKFKLVDQYTYVAYGVIYTEDNYGGKYKNNIDITFKAEEDSSDPRGYSFTMDAEIQ